MYKFSKHYSGSDNIIFNEEDIFITEVPLSKHIKLNGELNEGQRKVFTLIKNSNGIQSTDISSKLNIPFSTIDKHVRILLKKGLIERRGSKKTGGYFAKKTRNDGKARFSKYLLES